MFSIKKILVVFLLFSFPLFGELSLKEHMLRDLDHIQQTFSVKYAPLLWKETYKGWLLEEEIKLAKKKVQKLRNPTIREFQKIVTEFFQSTADYHVMVTFYATAYSILDFTIKSAEGRFFIVEIDRDFLPKSRFSCEVGDEILSFNGVAIKEAIQQFRIAHYPGGNTPETDQGLAEFHFTQRFAAVGHETPEGSARLEVRHKNGEVRTYTLYWDHNEEKIATPGLYHATKSQNKAVVRKHSSVENFMTRKMCTPYWSPKKIGARHKNSSHGLGDRTSFLGELGKKEWSTNENNFFDAYRFRSPKGDRIGYIRIAHYMADEEEAREFEELIEEMESETDALIIDQLNNPGGSVFYLYALASMLTEKALVVPEHHISLTHDDIFMAVAIVNALEETEDLDEVKEIIGETFGGYVVTEEFAEELKEFAKALIDEWNEGRMVTRPLRLLGVKTIQPNPYVRYTKPILVVINSLDFSGGDFFPAILQDNKRALIVGTRTAGAGGYVLQHEFFNRTSIASFNVTGSLAIREGGDPLENLGVEPDIKLDLTVRDMQNNYREYKEKLLSLLDGILKNK